MPKYRALTGLTVPWDEAEDARIREAREAGTPIPHEERKLRSVPAGRVARYIPELSVPWLLEQGHIEVVDDDAEAADE